VKKISLNLIAAALLSLVATAGAQDDTTRVLFIGNSHTYTFNVPGLFAGLAQSGGHAVVTDMSAPGGYTLLQHTTYQPTLQKIALGTWDYVSLQEQSLYPVIDYYRFNSFYPSARGLDSLITGLGQQTILYMTWGRPNGGQWSIGGNYTIDFVDFFHMQDSVSVSFEMLAQELGEPLVPAGNAWARAKRADSTLSLWGSDSLHATLNGAYLAACVFYGTLFQESPIGLSYLGGLRPEVALFLQQMADQTVSGTADDARPRAESFGLFQNYPNPFNAGTTLAFELPEGGSIVLVVYNILGERVRTLADGPMAAGFHRVAWDGKNEEGGSVNSGLYFSVLTAASAERSLKLLLIK
jgi:hypothetical protein